MDEERSEQEVLDGEIVLTRELALQAPQPSAPTALTAKRPAVPVALAAVSGFAFGAAAVAVLGRRRVRAIAAASTPAELEPGIPHVIRNGRTTYLISVRALVSSE